VNVALLLALAGTLMQPWGSHLKGNARVLIMGLPECGKTTFARTLTADAFRAVFFDPAGDYSAPGRLDVTLAELQKWPGLLDDPHARIVVKPQADDERGLAAEARVLINLAFEAGDLVLVLDEVGDYGKHAAGPLSKLVRRGRHEGIASVLVSQFATDFPKTCRRAASDVYGFLQKHPDDLAALEHVYGPAFSARVASWRKYEPPAAWHISEE